MTNDNQIDGVVTSGDERRRHDRTRLIVDVFFDGADTTGVASTQDISAGGLYMNTHAALPQGAMLMMRLPLPERDVVINAEVVYVNEGRGVGVRFRDMSEEDRATLQRALAAPSVH